METNKRSVIKSLSWRIVGILVLAVTSYVITGNLRKMTWITAIYTVVQLALYFLHERVWDKINWGKIEHPLSDLPVKEKLAPADREKIKEKLQELGYM